MAGFSSCYSLRQQVSRSTCFCRRKFFDRFQLALQLETEIVQSCLYHQWAMLTPRIVNELRFSARRVAANQLHWNLSPFDCRARNPGTIGEVAQAARNRTPAPAHARLRYSGFAAVRCLLVDHQIEGHVLREQLREFPEDVIARVDHLRRELHPEAAINTGSCQRGILDCLDQYATLLCPLLDALIEEMPRQAVHFADISTM